MTDLDQAGKARLGRRATLLAALSVTYNVVEAVIAITAGVAAGSFGHRRPCEASSGLVRASFFWLVGG